MKKLFLLLVGCIISIIPMLGQVAVATLSHEKNITAYYGAYALTEAYKAAEEGDVITLSPGTFAAIDIDKSIIIRGAGMEDNASKKYQTTFINGDFSLKNSSEEGREITIEGIYNNGTIKLVGNIDHIQFIKCRLNKLESSSSNNWANLTFMNCKIASKIEVSHSKSMVSFINSIVVNPYNSSGTTHSNHSYENSVILFTGSNISSLLYSALRNCIIYNNSSYTLNDSNIANNCVGTGSKTNIWQSLSMGNNSVAENIFKTFKGTYTDSETFELTDEAKTKYLGGDGTEVGIYGGTMPFDPTPSNPQITKFEVAPKSTPDGKLSIDIVVE